MDGAGADTHDQHVGHVSQVVYVQLGDSSKKRKPRIWASPLPSPHNLGPKNRLGHNWENILLLSNQICYQVSKPEMEFHMIHNICGIAHARTNRKDNIFMQRRQGQIFLCILEWSLHNLSCACFLVLPRALS